MIEAPSVPMGGRIRRIGPIDLIDGIDLYGR